MWKVYVMDLEKLASSIFYDMQNKISYSSLPKDLMLNPKDRESGYKVQDILIKMMEMNSGTVFGWKVALTNKEMQRINKVNEPIEGAILASRIQDSEGYIDTKNFLNIGVEGEIAVRIGKDITLDTLENIEKVFESIESVMAALEIVDDREGGSNISLSMLAAQNSLNRGAILGKEYSIDGLDLKKIEGTLMIDQTVVGEGSGSNVLENPINVIFWLAKSLINRGRLLKAGDIVLTGSLSTTVWPISGQTVTLNTSSIGSASVFIA